MNGPVDTYLYAKQLIEDLIRKYQSSTASIAFVGDKDHFSGSHTCVAITDKHYDQIVGARKNGLLDLAVQSGTRIFVSSEKLEGNKKREMRIYGDRVSRETCKQSLIQIFDRVSKAITYLS